MIKEIAILLLCLFVALFAPVLLSAFVDLLPIDYHRQNDVFFLGLFFVWGIGALVGDNYFRKVFP